MANCNETTKPTSCYQSDTKVVSHINCGCTPCDAPVIIDKGDISTQVLVPVLADVIQNCMNINKYETAYPNNLVFQTNLPKDCTPEGPICISGITYSYDCIGVGSTASCCKPGYMKNSTQVKKIDGNEEFEQIQEVEQAQNLDKYPFIPNWCKDDNDPVPATPIISAYVNSKCTNLSGTSISCSCKDISKEGMLTKTTVTNICNQFSGSIKTSACCCNQVEQAYSLTKLVEKKVPFYACNLKISISGTIGGTPFTASLIGTEKANSGSDKVDFLPNGLALEEICFPKHINFAGRFCLPTNTKLNITEDFDNCLIVDCIRPINSNYCKTEDKFPGNYSSFVASGDLSLVINQNVYATVTEKLAVMTNLGAQVVCGDGNATAPTCPTMTQCNNSRPCPSPSCEE